MERLEVEEERERRQQLKRVLEPAGAVTPPQASRRRRGRQHRNAVGKELFYEMLFVLSVMYTSNTIVS